jgi:phenylacetate-CoA ligase
MALFSIKNSYRLYSQAPDGLLKRNAQDNFRKIIKFVSEHSPFYRRKFEALKIDPKKIKVPADLGDFFTTSEDLRANPEEFICSKPDTAYETTGTTSKRPKRVYFSRNEVREAGWSGAVGLWSLGVRPEDRVASAFDYSFWVSGPVLQASCESLGCFHIEAGRIPPAEFYDRVKDYRVNVIVGDPSWLLGLTEIAKEKGTRNLRVSTLRMCGNAILS